MRLEILEKSNIKVEEDVRVDFTDGETVIYHSKQIQHLILNPVCVKAITIQKGN